MAEIEAAVLERPVNDLCGANDPERAKAAKSVYPGLSRSWKPGETIETLREQHRQCLNAEVK
jgi:hypothetical protein